MENGKVCNGCNEFKKNDDLIKYKKRNGQYGYNSMCKACESKRKKKYDRTDYENLRNRSTERKEYINEHRRCNKTCEQCENKFIGHKYKEQKLCQDCKELNKQVKRLVIKKLERSMKEVKEQQKKQKIIDFELTQKQKRTMRNKECVQCGESFVGKKINAKYCCDDCRKKSANRKKELSRDIKMKKAKLNGKFDYDITLEKLIKRDGMECYICHKGCTWDDHTRTSDGHFVVGKTYPTVEHVVAVSNGGTHSWDNVKVACYECNTNKGTKYLSEVI